MLFSNMESSFSNSCHTMESASEISSSQPYFCLHRLCNRLLAGRMGTTNPRETTTDKIPLRVGAFPSSMMRKLKSPVSMAHCTPKVRFTGRSSKSKFTTKGALSITGTVAITFLSLLIHLVSRNPPLESNSRNWPDKRAALSVVGTDLSQSST